ncbi:MAG: hypothetical protein BWY43_00049 [candidate division WS2 bacterium ADurb.Bin280]|uniref:Uncharacterized protein n=1 Tax=candidate division WS2 bacterium ADurb.Bin280 TaxID=1852829 RepID=A0A1V5SFK6_9BACT|nr:MAG: hypothetical protein BWY43_00049 [candidate division WS2 bacterium ADurb.Bin280]
MDFIDQILNQARNTLVCPVCKNRYEDERLRFRGFIDNTYIFQGFCASGHEPTAVTYLASLHRLEKPIGTYFHNISGDIVSNEQFLDAEKIINSHKGKISELFQDK